MMSSGSGPPPASSPSTSAAVAHPSPPPPPQQSTTHNLAQASTAYHQQHQLRQAAARGDLPTCRRLLTTATAAPSTTTTTSSRCLRFSRDERGRSALHLAAAAGHSAVVRLLLTHAAVGEVDAPDGGGCAPLQRAAADGRDDVVHLLLAHGADADRQDGVHGNTALHEASWKGYSRTVRLLAAAGADLSKPNAGGFAALHLCCQNGHNQSCRELLLAGADPDSVNNYGDTALHTAARYGHAGVTRILISAQCRVSDVNKNGDTALHIAAAMGRRKLTRILLEAGCDRQVRNKQGETARDIAVRKDLTEIMDILDERGGNNQGLKRDKKSIKGGGKKQRSKSKVRFEGGSGGKRVGKDVVDSLEKVKHWSPYGCHYYPDPEAFPSPRLDSLPQEPLKKGEQYYLDLAGNIRKGPVGVGYTCYCAPLFRQLEARVERDKRELQRAQLRLGQRVQGLEQRLLLERDRGGRRSERAPPVKKENQEALLLPRSRSLEMLAENNVGGEMRQQMQPTRSMDELEADDDEDSTTNPRPSVKELVARIQLQKPFNNNFHHSTSATSAAPAAAHPHIGGNNSESSDDEDNPLRMSKQHGPMGDSNLVQLLLPPNYENLPSDAPPRSRSGVYSPTIVNTSLVMDQSTRYVEPIVKVQEFSQPSTSKYLMVDPYAEYYQQDLINPSKYYEHTSLNTRLAKLRVLDSAANKSIPSDGPSGVGGGGNSRAGMLEGNYGNAAQHGQDNVDRDTNNDSGYSTKVYGSSKGNSPSLSGGGGGPGDCLGSSSLV